MSFRFRLSRLPGSSIPSCWDRHLSLSRLRVLPLLRGKRKIEMVVLVGFEET